MIPVRVVAQAPHTNADVDLLEVFLTSHSGFGVRRVDIF